MSAAHDEDAALTRLTEEGTRPDRGGLVVRYGSHPDQCWEAYGPEDGDAPLVLVHGGYFRPGIDRTHARPMARALADAGRWVLLLEYRRVPGDPGATTADLRAAETRLRADGDPADLADLTWVGHSAGGALVLWRVLQPGLPPVRAVALAPVGDLARAAAERLGDGAVTDWIGGPPRPAGDDALDPTRLLAAHPDPEEVLARTAVLHGDVDGMVPLTQSAPFAASRTVLPGAHHVDVVDPASPHWPAVLAAVSRR